MRKDFFDTKPMIGSKQPKLGMPILRIYALDDDDEDENEEEDG